MAATSFAIIQIDPHVQGYLEAMLVAHGYGDRRVGGTIDLNGLGFEAHAHAEVNRETQRLDWLLAAIDECIKTGENGPRIMALLTARYDNREGRDAINAAMQACP